MAETIVIKNAYSVARAKAEMIRRGEATLSGTAGRLLDERLDQLEAQHRLAASASCESQPERPDDDQADLRS